jgi:hypothetical protein
VFAALELARGLAGFVEHCEIHAERRVGRFGPRDRLENQVHGRAAASACIWW